MEYMDMEFMENQLIFKEHFKPMWDAYLNKRKIDKLLVNQYNTKQALIQALERIGVNSILAKNEVLLQFLIGEFSDRLDAFPIIIEDSYSKRVIDNLEKLFENTVSMYESFFKTRLIIKDEEDYCSVMIFEHTYQCDYDLNTDIDLWLNKVVNAYYFENGQIRLDEVIFDKKTHHTITRRNTSDILTSYSKERIAILSTTDENTYDETYKMLSDIKYVLEDANFDLKQFTLANKQIYTYMKNIIVNSDGKTAKYIEKDKLGTNLEADIEFEYSKSGYDFMNKIHDCNTEKTDFNYRTNELINKQEQYYKGLGISEDDYIIKYDDTGFYSTVYEFPLKMIEQLNNMSDDSKILRFHRMMKRH